MSNYVAVWSLRRGIIDPPEPLSEALQYACEMADAMPERKPVQSVSVEEMWAQQDRELQRDRSEEHRQLRLRKQRIRSMRNRLVKKLADCA